MRREEDRNIDHLIENTSIYYKDSPRSTNILLLKTLMQ